MLLCCFLNTCKGEVTGISFVDSTPIEVCHPCRSRSHKVFKDIAGWGKNSMGWHFGFKLHCIWNFLVNLIAGLIAYTYLPHKPSLDLEPQALSALPTCRQALCAVF